MKKLIFILVLVLLLFSVSSCNQNKHVSDYTYEVTEDKTIKITCHEYDPAETSITIPQKIEGRPIEVIGEDCFYQHKNLEKIRLPNDLITIEGSPFYRCYNLKECNLPKGVKFLDANPFFRCSSLTKITVDSKNKNFIAEDGVLYTKDMTILVAYPEGKTDKTFTVPSQVRAILGDSFGYHPKFKRIEIKSNVSYFPEYNMFVFPDEVTLVVEPNSNAEDYAKANELKYEYFS